MAKWEVGHGCDDYIKQLEKLSDKSADIIGKAIYEGAKIAADEFSDAIDALPSTVISEVQRQGLHDGLGISTEQNQNGFLNVKIGMDGYNNDSRYKRGGEANAAVARRINSGTSTTPAEPWLIRTTNSVKASVENKMKSIIEQEINNLTK